MTTRIAEHTKEPWYVRDYPNDDMISSAAINDRNMIYCTRATEHGTPPKVSEKERAANAHRIVACVNACAGVDDETLGKIARKEMDGSEFFELSKMRQQLAALEARNAELVGALKKHGCHGGDCDYSYGHDCNCGLAETIAKQVRV